MTARVADQLSQEPRPWRFLAILFTSAFVIVALVRFVIGHGEGEEEVATSSAAPVAQPPA